MDLSETQRLAERFDVAGDCGDAVVSVLRFPGSADPALVEEDEPVRLSQRLHPREKISVGEARASVKKQNRFAATHRSIEEAYPGKRCVGLPHRLTAACHSSHRVTFDSVVSNSWTFAIRPHLGQAKGLWPHFDC